MTPQVLKESDKHLHGVKRTGTAGGKRGISVTLGIRKHFPSKEQLGWFPRKNMVGVPMQRHRDQGRKCSGGILGPD